MCSAVKKVYALLTEGGGVTKHGKCRRRIFFLPLTTRDTSSFLLPFLCDYVGSVFKEDLTEEERQKQQQLDPAAATRLSGVDNGTSDNQLFPPPPEPLFQRRNYSETDATATEGRFSTNRRWSLELPADSTIFLATKERKCTTERGRERSGSFLSSGNLFATKRRCLLLLFCFSFFPLIWALMLSLARNAALMIVFIDTVARGKRGASTAVLADLV